MRLLSEYELDLVAGGTSSSDFYPDGSGTFDNGNGFGGGGGGGGGSGGYGMWYWVPVPVSVSVGGGPNTPSWSGYWAFSSHAGGPTGPTGGNSTQPGGASGSTSVDLEGRDCPADVEAAKTALALLAAGSSTAKSYIDAAANNGVDINLVKANLNGTGPQASFDSITNDITWDPFVSITGTNSNGTTYTLSPIMILAHELVHAGSPGLAGPSTEALVILIANQIAREMNAAAGDQKYDTSRDNHNRNGMYNSVSSTSSTYTLVRPGCP